ncbi:hypothetical protein KDW_27480 [Dictyobacter vulcani]|uniref:Uncharacterized protein n=1 Tax=Dictyobacter vulcani TaxID=2607529 RepID=A0A5J4KTQ8_9CHLR|nr:hypothetical protein [Dictyobacter vulcani]GER88586.1 hypothetical protein KDW_27480 [Dictyobacter vulcani]
MSYSPSWALIQSTDRDDPDPVMPMRSSNWFPSERLPILILWSMIFLVRLILIIAAKGGNSALEKLGRDLTKQASNKQLTPLIGREKNALIDN